MRRALIAGVHRGIVHWRSRRPAGRVERMALLRRRRRQLEILAARSDQRGERRATARGVAMELARQRDRGGKPPGAAGHLRGHAADGERCHVHLHRSRRHRGDRSRHRQDHLAIRSGDVEGGSADESRVPAPRSLVLDRRHRRAAVRRHSRRLPDLGRREDGQARHRVRHRRARRSHRTARLRRTNPQLHGDLGAGGRAQRGDLRRRDLRRTAAKGDGAGRRQRFRRAHRASGCGRSDRCHSPASTATTRGKATPPNTPATRTSGR